MTIPARSTFVSLVLLALIFGSRLQPARGESIPITGTACVQHAGCQSISASGPGFSINSNGLEPADYFCADGTFCAFAQTITTGQCNRGTTSGSFNGQGADCLVGSVRLAAASPTYVPILNSSGVGVEFILPMVLTGQITGYENGTEVWALNIAGTGTMDVSGFEQSGEYNLLNTTYEFSGIAYTPEPPAWTYAFSALSIIMVAQRKKLLSLFRDAAA